MSYTITIGNATPKYWKEDGLLWARWEVATARSNDAPTFPHDDLTENSNVRCPAYGAWYEFCRTAGLFALFMDEDIGLMREHPGCFILNAAHLETVTQARIAWERHTTSPPGFTGKYDAVLARLLWLEWWMKWALDNCETPAIENS